MTVTTGAPAAPVMASSLRVSPGTPTAATTAAAAAIAIWPEADAFPVVIVERITGVQQQPQARVADACPIVLDPVPVQQSGIS